MNYGADLPIWRESCWLPFPRCFSHSGQPIRHVTHKNICVSHEQYSDRIIPLECVPPRLTACGRPGSVIQFNRESTRRHLTNLVDARVRAAREHVAQSLIRGVLCLRPRVCEAARMHFVVLLGELVELLADDLTDRRGSGLSSHRGCHGTYRCT